MALIRWEPVPMNRLFNSLFDSATLPSAPSAPVRRFAPAIDLIESDSHYLVRADLPGVNADDVSVELSSDVLTIAGERSSRSETREGGYRRIERSSGSFRRSIRLPRGVDAAAIEASFDNGVLEVSVPRPESPATHRVEISTGADSAPVIETSDNATTPSDEADSADSAVEAPAAA